MLDNLGKNLSGLIKRLVTGTTVDEKAVEELLQDLRKVLLQSDVDIALADKLISDIRKKCLKEKLPAGMTLREHALKTIYDELVKLLGESPAEVADKKRIMFIGLYGSGKTTSIAKLARFYKKKGKRPPLPGSDRLPTPQASALASIGKKLLS